MSNQVNIGPPREILAGAIGAAVVDEKQSVVMLSDLGKHLLDILPLIKNGYDDEQLHPSSLA